MGAVLLAIDQGTTSSRAIVFSPSLVPLSEARAALSQHYPAAGWVEHEPEELWSTTLSSVRAALDRAGASAEDVAAIGVANQRETTILWDRATGRAIHRAIVWQDRRTAPACAALKAAGCADLVARRTGLLLDPYFSATKIAWLLDEVPGARARAERGELAFGTVDTFLIWRLTGGRVHATDATNASRTLLFDIHRGDWDDALLALMRVPRAILPDVRDCAADFGLTDPAVFGAAVPISGAAGDQQAATIGQACFQPGMVKSTYGTGCFVLLNTGETPVASQARLLTTIAYQFAGKRAYALEGSIFVAGAAVQWLRDGLGLIADVADADALAEAADPARELILVPAFVGLGAPHWDPQARGALYGLTRDSGPADVARAALESVCLQTADLLAAMRADWPGADGVQTVLRVDGGVSASDWTMQRLADILGAPVDRPSMQETTALGAAYLAGYGVGLLPEPARFADLWRLERRFEPRMPAQIRARKLAAWSDAVRRTAGALGGDPDALG